MTFCISLGVFKLKYLLYCVLYFILEIIIMFFIYDFDEDNKKIFQKHRMLDSFCFILGYLLNFIPIWINYKCSKAKVDSGLIEEKNSIKYIYNNPYNQYLSTKDIIKFFGMCLMLLSLEFVELILKKLNKENLQYEDDFLLFKFLVVFLLPKYFSEVYYKHKNISIIIFILIEIIKNIFYLIRDKEYKKDYSNFIIITFLRVIYSSLSAFYYLYIKDLMRHKYISPYKCNFMIGIINFPLFLIIMFIISFTPLGKKENDEYLCDNIFELFQDIANLNNNIVYIILLILLPFIYGLLLIDINKTIYDFTVYHIFIPLLVSAFIKDIVMTDLNDVCSLTFLISSFIIELIMILVFLEIIEVNFCELNKNLKRNIEDRGVIDSSLTNEDDDFDNDERNTINNETTK